MDSHAAVQTASGTVWTPDALIDYPLVEHVHLSSDGGQLVYTVRYPYLSDEAGEFRCRVYRASADGSAAPQAVTHGATALQPRWSPDGRYIAFLRPAPETGKPGLWVMPAQGGEPWPLTGKANGIRHAITTFKWSPDGTQLAFLAAPWDEELEARRKRHDDAVQWRVDYSFSHLFLVDFAAEPAAETDRLPPVRPLTQGRLHVQGFDWRPDGREIALIHQPTPYLEGWPDARLATIAIPAEAEGAPPAPVDRGVVATSMAEPFYSPDGRWIACGVSQDRRWPHASRMQLFPVDAVRDDAAPRPLAQVDDEQPMAIGWAPDGSAVYVRNNRGFGVELLALPVDGGAPRTLVPADRLISVVHVTAQGKAALVCQDLSLPNRVEVVDLTAAQPTLQVAAAPQAPGFPDGPLPRVEFLQWTGPDQTPVEGMLYLPAGYDAARDGRLPLVLHIHGGPAGIFQRAFAGDPHVYSPAALCEQGIAVLRPNPRGSGGYGRAFRYANQADWGGGDYADLMAGVDTVIAQGIADPDRLGVAGWSYGGYMTSWIVTQTERFQAASIGAPVTNLISFIGTSDIPSFIPDYFGGEFWERFDLYRARSPIFHAHRARTPVLLQHGDADERVPLEQGLQFATVLARAGTPVEMIIYPRQGHALNEPRLVADAIRRNLAWFTAKLAPAPLPHV